MVVMDLAATHETPFVPVWEVPSSASLCVWVWATPAGGVDRLMIADGVSGAGFGFTFGFRGVASAELEVVMGV